VPRHKKRPWAFWLVTFLTQVALWILFVSNLDPLELIVALGAAALATFGAAVFEATAVGHFRPTLADLLQIRRIPSLFVSDTARVLRAVTVQVFTRRSPHSSLLALKFPQTGRSATARRALATTYTTLTPNSIVLGFIHDRNLMLYHELVPSPIPKILREMGAHS